MVGSLIPKTVQTLLFSATFPDNVRVFASKFAPNANQIALKKEELSVEGIKQFYLDCKSEGHKYEILVELYGLLTIGQSIIFCKVCINQIMITRLCPLSNSAAPRHCGSDCCSYDSGGTSCHIAPWRKGCLGA